MELAILAVLVILGALAADSNLTIFLSVLSGIGVRIYTEGISKGYESYSYHILIS